MSEEEIPDHLRDKPKKRGRPKKSEQERTKTAKVKFLEHYAKWGVISRAAKEAGVTRQAYYKWIAEEPNFEEECKEARQEYLEGLEARLKELVDEGNVTAILAALKAELPEKYGDRTKIQFVPDKDVLRLVAEVLTKHVDSETLQAILAELDSASVS